VSHYYIPSGPVLGVQPWGDSIAFGYIGITERTGYGPLEGEEHNLSIDPIIVLQVGIDKGKAHPSAPFGFCKVKVSCLHTP
jgi:hypothetical protein